MTPTTTQTLEADRHKWEANCLKSGENNGQRQLANENQTRPTTHLFGATP